MGRLTEGLYAQGWDRRTGVGSRGGKGRVFDQGLGVKIEFDADSIRIIEDLQKKAPLIMQRAKGRAANTAKRSLFKTIRRHGKNPKIGLNTAVSKRQRLTVRLHGGRPGDTFGKFSSDSAYLVSYLKGQDQIIGWVDNVHKFMSALQSAENRDFEPGEKRFMKSSLISRGEKNPHIPASYSRPDRDIINPFTARMNELYPKWVIDNFNKLYNEQIARRK